MTETRAFLPVRLSRLDDRYCPRMDPLADVMDVSRVRGAMLANVRACAPWGLDLPQSSGASFHALTAGTAWLRVGERLRAELDAAGDRETAAPQPRGTVAIDMRPGTLRSTGEPLDLGELGGQLVVGGDRVLGPARVRAGTHDRAHLAEVRREHRLAHGGAGGGGPAAGRRA